MQGRLLIGRRAGEDMPQLLFNIPFYRYGDMTDSIDIAAGMIESRGDYIFLLMQLLVEIEFCIDCHQHAWCSQHDEEKYLYYFHQIRDHTLQKIKLGDNLIIRPKQVPKHFVRVTKNNAHNKYFDTHKEEEVYFPRLGAFEIFVDGILLFSKIKSNMWPKIERQSDNIIEIMEAKKKGQTLSAFEFSTNVEQQQKNKFFKNYQKRGTSNGNTPQRERKLPHISMHQGYKTADKEIIINSLTEENQLTPNHRYDLSNRVPKSLMMAQQEDKPLPPAVKTYHQIYSSALYEMREMAKRQKIQSKQHKERVRKVTQRKSQNIKRRFNSEQEEELVDEFVQIPPITQPKRSLSVKKKNKKEYPSKKPNHIDKLIEDELNISQIVTPHELNEEQKKMLYKKYNIDQDQGPKDLNDKKLQAEKRKYETLLDALKHEQKNYVEKLYILNKKLGVTSKKNMGTIESKKSGKVGDSDRKKQDQDIAFPPIKNQFSSAEGHKVQDNESPVNKKGSNQDKDSKQGRKPTGSVNRVRQTEEVHSSDSHKNKSRGELVEKKTSGKQLRNKEDKITESKIKQAASEEADMRTKVDNFLSNERQQKQKEPVEGHENKKIQRRKLSIKKIIEINIDVPEKQPEPVKEKRENTFTNQVINQVVVAPPKKEKTFTNQVFNQVVAVPLNKQFVDQPMQTDQIKSKKSSQQQLPQPTKDIPKSESTVEQQPKKTESSPVRLEAEQKEYSKQSEKAQVAAIEPDKTQKVDRQKVKTEVAVGVESIKFDNKTDAKSPSEHKEIQNGKSVEVELTEQKVMSETKSAQKLQQKVKTENQPVTAQQQKIKTQPKHLESNFHAKQQAKVYDPAVQKVYNQLQQNICIEGKEQTLQNTLQVAEENIENTPEIVEQEADVHNEAVVEEVQQQLLPVSGKPDEQVVEENIETVKVGQSVDKIELRDGAAADESIPEVKEYVETVKPEEVTKVVQQTPAKELKQTNQQPQQTVSLKQGTPAEELKKQQGRPEQVEKKIEPIPTQQNQKQKVAIGEIEQEIEKVNEQQKPKQQTQQSVGSEKPHLQAKPKQQPQVKQEVVQERIISSSNVQKLEKAGQQIAKEETKFQQIEEVPKDSKQASQQAVAMAGQTPLSQQAVSQIHRDSKVEANATTGAQNENPSLLQSNKVQSSAPSLVEQAGQSEQINSSSMINSTASPAKRSPSRRPPSLVGRISAKKHAPQYDTELNNSEVSPQKNQMSSSSIRDSKAGKIVSSQKVDQNQNIVLHVDQNYARNPFVTMYDVKKNKITKKYGDGLWHILKTEEVLPFRGKYTVSVNIVESALNCIEMGIMPQEFTPVENKLCTRSIGFHFANGKIHDTNGDKEKKATSWRLAREAAQPGEKGILEMVVDVDNQLIKWRFEGKQFAFSTLTDCLKNQNCVAYISMVNVKDVVIISPEKQGDRSLSPLLQVKNNETSPQQRVPKQEQKDETKNQKQLIQENIFIEGTNEQREQKMEKKYIEEQHAAQIVNQENQQEIKEEKIKQQERGTKKQRKDTQISFSGLVQNQFVVQEKKENEVVRPSPIEVERGRPTNEIQIPMSTSQIGSPVRSESPAHIKVNQQEAPPSVQDFPKINISVSLDKSTNPFLDFYDVKKDTIVKTGGNGLWHILKMNEVLPSTGKCSFAMKVAESEINCVEIGIMPQEYTPVENKICEKGLGFHFANGKVHDTKGSKEKRTTAWRSVCEPAAKGTLGTIELDVDADNQMIHWKFEGKVFAKSVITSYLKERPCVPYISAVHVKDTVVVERYNESTSSIPLEHRQLSTNSPHPLKQDPKEQIKNTQLFDPIPEVKLFENKQSLESSQFPLITATIDQNPQSNPFLNLYSFQNQTITKVDKTGLWHIVRAKQVLPKERKYSLSFTIVKSEMNCIEVGIMPGDYEIVENKICVKSIGLNFANGKLHDTNGVRQKNSTKWREVCAPVPAGVTGTIQLEVDSEAQVMYWKFQGNKFAQSVLTNHLKSKELHAYVSMVHVGDVVLLNQGVNKKVEAKQGDPQQGQ